MIFDIYIYIYRFKGLYILKCSEQPNLDLFISDIIGIFKYLIIHQIIVVILNLYQNIIEFSKRWKII